MATVAAGVLTMGADPPRPMPPLPVPPVERGEAMARAFPTPRLFEITMTVNGKREGPTQYCMSSESAARQIADVRARAAARTTPPGQGCTHHSELRPVGSMHMETVCDKAAGASTTYRSTMDGDAGMRDFRHHLESQTGQPAHKQVIDTHVVQLGDCPGDLKPGQMRLSDGRVRDMALANPSR